MIQQPEIDRRKIEISNEMSASFLKTQKRQKDDF